MRRRDGAITFTTGWGALKTRCYNDRNPDFKFYGAHGTAVCARWHQFENFLADILATIGERPSAKHSLGRINK